MHCHDMLLLHDGIVFVPMSNGQCPAGPVQGMMAAMFSCKCGNGEVLWNNPSPSTRKPLTLPASSSKQQAVGPSSADSTGPLLSQMSALSFVYGEKI
jgi:hypothetical protein